MLVYFDADNGDILWTMELAEGHPAPPGDRIVVDGPVHPALWRVDEGQLVPRADAADRLRAEAIEVVNRLAGEVRSRYLTVIPGQEMIYLQKEAEARAWLTATYPDPADYPFLSAEVGITGADPDQVAQVYVNLAAQLRVVAAQLETTRLGTVAVIETATSADTIETAIAVFRAAAEAFP